MITSVKVQGSGYLVNNDKYVPSDTSNKDYVELSKWLMANTPDPEFTASELSAKAKTTNKINGVEFEGVMCSATAEDMWGLSSIRSYIVSGNSTPFKFDNGEVLLLTPQNLSDFESVWIPFRQSFFS